MATSYLLQVLKQNCDWVFYTSGVKGKVIDHRSNMEKKLRYVFVIFARR